MADTLDISEIFVSIQGEGTRAGLPCVLVRLAGCNLRCRWCDSPYTWDHGTTMTLDEIVQRVQALRCPLVELTGGEPLLQEQAPPLLGRLVGLGYQVLLETNGSMDIGCADPAVVRIVDIKCPSSGQSHASRWENIPLLRPTDEVKFVLADREDFDYAREVIAEHRLADRCTVLMSPAGGLLPPATLSQWMLEDDRLPRQVRLNLQLHRIIWPDKTRGV